MKAALKVILIHLIRLQNWRLQLIIRLLSVVHHLTAVDAVRTLARHNGKFIKDKDDQVLFKLADNNSKFKMIMHTRGGLLPAIRFHLEDTSLGKDAVLSHEAIENNRAKNDGFLSLDFVFENQFKQPIKDKTPGFL